MMKVKYDDVKLMILLIYVLFPIKIEETKLRFPSKSAKF